MRSFHRLWIAGAAVALIITAAILAALAFPVTAAPPQQDLLPTPSPEPIEELVYTFSVVGGDDQTLTFDHGTVDGITLGESTVTSHYPRGMVFTLAPNSPNGEIEDVILFLEFPNGTRTRFNAAFDTDQNTWIARPWELGDGTPAWVQFTFAWRVRDSSGAFADSDPVASEYWDPTRQWYRLDMPDFLIFWYGAGDDNPEAVAEYLALAIESTEQRRIDGFGAPLSYKPLGVLYPTQNDYGETSSSGTTRPNVSGITLAGVARPEIAATVQFFLLDLRTPQTAIEGMAGSLTHEMTHMYQNDVVGGSNGPLWWVEGQAEWFSYNPGLYDQRMVNLAGLQDLPSLTGEISAGLPAADGYARLAYDVGASFVNWLVAEYGLDAMQAINQSQARGIPFYTSIEEITGQSFLNIENRWRAYLGFRQLTLAEIDPASALEPYDDPLLSEGDTVTLPAMPPLVPMKEKPGERVLVGAQCFANMSITILRIGALDGTPYYEVDCMGMTGWVTRDQIVGP